MPGEAPVPGPGFRPERFEPRSSVSCADTHGGAFLETDGRGEGGSGASTVLADHAGFG